MPQQPIADTTSRVLAVLYDRAEGFISYDELAGAARISCDMVDGMLDDIRRRKHQIEFSPSMGVRLQRPVHLDAHLIERGLRVQRVGQSVICFDEVGSTNDVAMDSARQGGTDGLVVLADSQRGGRGRQGSRWVSPPGRNLLMSALLIDDNGDLAHEALTIATGLAVAEGIDRACGVQCRLKWPNDVLLGGAKVAGVLVEIRPSAAGRAIVLGIGVNVNAAPASGEVERPATSLADRVGHPVERIDVARAVIARLDEWVRRVAGRDLTGVHDGWMRRCGMINERVTIDSAGRRYVGRVSDVDPLEGLILFDDNGRRVHLPAEYSTVLD